MGKRTRYCIGGGIICLILLVILAIVTPLGVELNWSNKNNFDQVVWADDQSGIALTQTSYQNRLCTACKSVTRNFKSQLYTANSDGSNKKTLGSEVNHQSGGSLYYMATVGYIITSVNYTFSKDGAELTISEYYKVLISSGEFNLVTAIADNYDSTTGVVQSSTGDVIPSPDGSILVSISITSLNGESLSHEVIINFFNASTLDLMGNSFKKNHNGTVDYTWDPLNHFRVTYQGIITSTFLYKVNSPPYLISEPNCFDPKTTSSSISASGEELYIQDYKQGTVASKMGQAFGCQ